MINDYFQISSILYDIICNLCCFDPSFASFKKIKTHQQNDLITCIYLNMLCFNNKWPFMCSSSNTNLKYIILSRLPMCFDIFHHGMASELLKSRCFSHLGPFSEAKATFSKHGLSLWKRRVATWHILARCATFVLDLRRWWRHLRYLCKSRRWRYHQTSRAGVNQNTPCKKQAWPGRHWVSSSRKLYITFPPPPISKIRLIWDIAL